MTVIRGGKMKILFKPRAAGKTTEAIKQAAKSGAYIVVTTIKEAQRVQRLAQEMGLHIRMPISFGEFMENRLMGSYPTNIIVDNADMFLQMIFQRMPVEMITLTKEEDDD